MHKFFVTTVLFFLAFPAFAANDGDFDRAFEEYARDFEMGMHLEDEPEFKPVQKEKFINEGDEVIEIEKDLKTVKLKTAKKKKIEPYRETNVQESGKNNFYENGKFSIFSNGEKVRSDYMTDDFKSSVNANYKMNNAINLNAGHETKYVNPNASINSRKFYVNPSLNLNKNLSVDYTGRLNQANKNFEQEVGLKYRPSFLKDSASFGIKAGSVMNNDREIQSHSVKFSSDLFLF